MTGEAIGEAIGLEDFVDAWNEHEGQTTPLHHRTIVRWLEAAWGEGRNRLLLMAFRGAGKSTLVGLFSAWLLRRDPRLRLLVLAAELSLALRMVRTTRRIIERHPMTGDMKPSRPEQWAGEYFTVERPVETRDPSMVARGVTANVTGARADVVICDDVEVPNTVSTAAKRESLRERLIEIEFILTPGGTQLYVGTPHHRRTIYATEEGQGEEGRDNEKEPGFLAGFDRLALPLLDAEGRSAWPERYPPEEIERRRKRSGPLHFESQMQLRPASLANARLDPTRLRRYEGELSYSEANRRANLHLNGRRLVSGTAWWDPALAKASGDGSVVAAVYVDHEGNAYLHRIAWLNAGPDEGPQEAGRQCVRVANFLTGLHLPSIHVEKNGIGLFLPELLKTTVVGRGMSISVLEETARKAKHLRILEAFDARMAAGSLHVHSSVWNTPFIEEMAEWRPEAPGLSDDGLDAVAGCLGAQSVPLARVDRPPPAPQWQRGVQPETAAHDFDV